MMLKDSDDDAEEYFGYIVYDDAEEYFEFN